jgi:hypothetical protein
VKVFISWSGEQSRQIASALREWLPMVIQAVRPYMSESDNEAGARWGSVVSAELESSAFGIVCLTPINITAPWINFEAGALSKAVDRARVVPLLYQLSMTDVAPPLSQFMMKPLDKEGILDTLKSINSVLDDERHLEITSLEGVFEAMWPTLEDKLKSVAQESKDGGSQPPPQRSDRQLLEEILQLLRQELLATAEIRHDVRDDAKSTLVKYRGVSQDEKTAAFDAFALLASQRNIRTAATEDSFAFIGATPIGLTKFIRNAIMRSQAHLNHFEILGLETLPNE